MHAVPSEAPRDLTAIAVSSTSIVTAWQLPVVDSRNGIIRGFKLFYKQNGSIKSPTIFLFENPLILSKTVAGLDESTEYEFQVLAFTSVGDGPKGPIVVAKTVFKKTQAKKTHSTRHLAQSSCLDY